MMMMLLMMLTIARGRGPPNTSRFLPPNARTTHRKSSVLLPPAALLFRAASRSCTTTEPQCMPRRCCSRPFDGNPRAQRAPAAPKALLSSKGPTTHLPSTTSMRDRSSYHPRPLSNTLPLRTSSGPASNPTQSPFYPQRLLTGCPPHLPPTKFPRRQLAFIFLPLVRVGVVSRLIKFARR